MPLDALLSPPGLFGDAVSSVVKRFQEAKKQAAAFQRFITRRDQSSGAVAKRLLEQASTERECCVSSPQSMSLGVEAVLSPEA